MRLFAGDRIYNIMNRFKIPDDQPMEAKILSNQIESAQKKVEEQNFVARKNVLKYDDVMNTQRMVIYEQRRRVLEGEDLSDEVREWIRETVESGVTQFTDAEFAEDWDLDGLVTSMQSLYGTDITVDELREEINVTDREALIEEFVEDALETYAEREQALGPELAREVERYVILQTVDQRWREHLETMDYLREGVHLRAFAQKDPLVEYRGEGHAMFEELGPDDPPGGRLHALPRRRRGRAARARADAGPRRSSLHYEHETSAGADVIAAAGAALRRRWPPRRRHAGVVRAGAGGERAQGHRPQRPVLVRVRQEVQALPRRLTVDGPRANARNRRLSRLLAAAFGVVLRARATSAIRSRRSTRRSPSGSRASLPGWVEWLARPFSWLGGWIGLTVLGIVVVVVLLRERAWLDLGFFLAAFLGSQLAVALLKAWFDRPRPELGSRGRRFRVVGVVPERPRDRRRREPRRARGPRSRSGSSRLARARGSGPRRSRAVAVGLSTDRPERPLRDRRPRRLVLWSGLARRLPARSRRDSEAPSVSVA